MKIIIAGAGNAGYQIAKQLVSEDKNVVLIEKDEDMAKYVSNSIDCMVINGNVHDLEILKQAGIQDADFFICITESDELNIISCSMVHNEFGNTYNIARVRDKRYYETKLIKNPDLGIDFIVNPEIESAKNIAKLVQYGVSSDIVFFEKSDIQMRKLILSSRSTLINKTLAVLRKEIPIDFLVGGVIRDDNFVIASGNTILKENDQIYILSTTEKLDKIFGLVGRTKTKIKNIVIVGGGVIGSYVLDLLLRKDKTISKFSRYFERPFLLKDKKYIRLIEKKENVSKALAAKYPEIIVINEDITDEKVFEEEQLGNCDLIITTTENTELNILIAIYAKGNGIKKSIALVKKINFVNISSKLGIDVLISPNDSIISSILKIIRRVKVKSIHTLANTDTEVIEMTIEKNSPVIGRQIKHIDFPKNLLVLLINRGNKSYIPDGSFIIKERDDIIIIANKKYITNIEKAFVP